MVGLIVFIVFSKHFIGFSMKFIVFFGCVIHLLTWVRAEPARPDRSGRAVAVGRTPQPWVSKYSVFPCEKCNQIQSIHRSASIRIDQLQRRRGCVWR